MTVAALKTGLPKLGVFSLSSIVIICIRPDLNPAKPSNEGLSTDSSGQVFTVGTILAALPLGL